MQSMYENNLAPEDMVNVGQQMPQDGSMMQPAVEAQPMPAMMPGADQGMPSAMPLGAPPGPPAEFQQAGMQLPEGVLDLGSPMSSDPVARPEGVLDLGSTPPEIKAAAPKAEHVKPVDTSEQTSRFDAILTGVHRGVSHFTLKALSLVPGLKEGVKKHEAETQAAYNVAKKDRPGYAIGGEIAGEVLATLPSSPLFGTALKAGTKAAEYAPVGLKTIAKYGTGATAVTEAGALLQGLKYNPNNDSILDTEAMKNTMTDPTSYIAGAVGVKLGAWADKAREYNKAKEILPSVLPRDVMSPGITRTVSQTFFDTLPAITGVGKRASQIDQIGDDIGRVVTKLAGTNEAMYAKDLVKYSGQKLQEGLQALKKGGQELWNKPFISQKINDSKAVKDITHEAMDVLKSSGIPLANRAKQMLQQGLRKGQYTVDDVKNLQTVIGDAAESAMRADSGGIGRGISKELNSIRHRLFEPVQGSLSKQDLSDFMAAREYSSRVFRMQDEIPHLRDAMVDEVQARKLIRNLVGGKETFDKNTLMGIIPAQGQQAAKAAKIAQALEAADHNGKIDIGTFLDKTAESTNAPELLGKSYDTIKGLNKYLGAIKEAGQVKASRAAALGSAVGVTAAGSVMANPAIGAGALIGYSAMNFAANHPVLKNMFGAMTKNLPDNTYKYLVDAATRHLARAGFIANEDGDIEDTNKRD